jgi:uncharacterized protein (TIGR03118 family)
MRKLSFKLLSTIGASLAFANAFLGCGKSSSSVTPPKLYYVRSNLISATAGYVDSAGAASHTDTRLGNPWGITYSPTGPFWVADNAAGGVTVYDGAGNSISNTGVYVPPPASKTGGSLPTGIVYNGTSDFTLTSGGNTVPALYIMATEDGTIAGWNPTISATQAVQTVDRSTTPGAVYTGLAIASTSSGNFLYAADFNDAQVDIFDKNYNYVRSFTDTQVDTGYAPFGIQLIGTRLVVTFAKQDSSKHNPVPGAGNGFVDVFDTNGNLVQRLIAHGQLNAPWGIAYAPASFGKYSSRLLIGNFGDGLINAYAVDSGAYQGQLLDGSSSNPIVIPGLWALSFGNGASAGASTALYFTAGVNSEQGGLFGVIQNTTLH